jgi:hypothetical protein
MKAFRITLSDEEQKQAAKLYSDALADAIHTTSETHFQDGVPVTLVIDALAMTVCSLLKFLENTGHMTKHEVIAEAASISAAILESATEIGDNTTQH